MDNEPLYYALTPIYEAKPGQIATAAIVTCMATGKTLAGYGGGGLALSSDIVDALDLTKNGYRARVVIDAEDFDDLVDLARQAVQTNGSVSPTSAAHLLDRLKK